MAGGTTHTPVAHPGRQRSVAAWLLTRPQRLDFLERTLVGFRQTDWDSPLRVHCTPAYGETGGTDEDPIHRGHLALLASAMKGPGTHFLVLEDDIALNLHLHHNLTRWALWRHVEEVDFAVLYNPGVRKLSTPAGGSTFFAADPDSVIGSSARLFSRRCAAYLLGVARGPGLRQDLRFPREAAAAFAFVWVHRPSLVQHRGFPSSWSGANHMAEDFAPDWKG